MDIQDTQQNTPETEVEEQQGNGTAELPVVEEQQEAPPETQTQETQTQEITFEKTGDDRVDDIAESLIALKIDPLKAGQELADNGKLSDETIAELSKTAQGRNAMRDIVNLYNDHITKQQSYHKERNETFTKAIGKDQEVLYAFAKTLPKEEVQAFNKAIQEGSPRDIELNILWLKNKYQSSNKDLPQASVTQQGNGLLSSQELYELQSKVRANPSDVASKQRLEAHLKAKYGS